MRAVFLLPNSNDRFDFNLIVFKLSKFDSLLSLSSHLFW